MDSSEQNQNPKICQKHNQEIIFFDEQQNQPLCFTCVYQKTGIISIDQLQQKQSEIKYQGDKQFQEQKQQLQMLLDSIVIYRQNLINGIDKIIQIIIDLIKNIHSQQMNFEQELESSNLLNTFDKLMSQLNNQKENYQNVKIQVKRFLSDFQRKYINLEHLNQILSQSPPIIDKQLDQVSRKFKIKIQEVQQQQIQKSEEFQYELVEESRMKESKYCHVFAFNNNDTILIIGCSQLIKVFDFFNGKIGKELQVLQNHKDFVYCLYFMKQSDSFVSGSRDHQIIIWKHENNDRWLPLQILSDHSEDVNCLLMNKDEDFLFSGSDDRTIKVWQKDYEQWNCYQTIQTDNYVFSISLNETENKLISCGNGTNILVIELQDDKQWKIEQKIIVGESGRRLLFTFKDQFVFQPKTKDCLEVFDLDYSSNQFKKQLLVQVKRCDDCCLLFPCQFVKSLNILLVKHGQYLNIFKLKDDKNYELIQTIQFQHQKYLYGTVSNDGQHLIIWDKGLEEIQVRKLKNMNDQFI